RPGSKFCDHPITTGFILQFDHAAPLVVEIPESDCLSWTGLLAGRHDLGIAHGAVLLFRLYLCVHDPLHAERALFHDAPASNSDLRVAHEFQTRCVVVIVEKEVEATALVRTVIRTVTRADTAVVDLDVKALRVVQR